MGPQITQINVDWLSEHDMLINFGAVSRQYNRLVYSKK